MSVLLDTHMWVWWITPSSRLRPREVSALDELAKQGELRLSAISLWEVQVLHSKRRLDLPVPFGEWLLQATDRRLLEVLPLDVDVILALHDLPAGFHGDPADRIIVATGRAHALTLATRDTTISSSRAIKIWRA